ncbi:MAG TPA: hypothetical protein VIY27_06330, partial [Myxococcota bacterium]
RLADAEEARDLAKARVEEFETQCDELETRCAKLVERADEVLDSFNELRKALHAILGLEGIDDPPAVDAVRAALRAHDDLLEGFSE